MKIFHPLLFSLSIVILNANQVSIKSCAAKRARVIDKIAQAHADNTEFETDSETNERIDFDDLDEDAEINTAALVPPLWARLANKIAAPLFTLYSNLNKWWNDNKENGAIMQKTRNARASY